MPQAAAETGTHPSGVARPGTFDRFRHLAHSRGHWRPLGSVLHVLSSDLPVLFVGDQTFRSLCVLLWSPLSAVPRSYRPPPGVGVPCFLFHNVMRPFHFAFLFHNTASYTAPPRLVVERVRRPFFAHVGFVETTLEPSAPFR